MKKRKFREKLMDKELLEETINKLVGEGYLLEERSLVIKNSLPEKIKQSEYVLGNLAVHAFCGAIFAFDIIPLPLGSISRGSWVAVNRAYYQIRRNKEKKEIHSGKVFLFSLVPWVGSLAYTIPLKQISEDLCYVYANHITYLRKNKSLEAYLEDKPKFIKGIMNNLLIPKYLRRDKNEQ